RPVLALIIQHKANRSVAYFRGKLVRRFAHRAPSYSGVGASGKPGAVHPVQQVLHTRQAKRAITAEKMINLRDEFDGTQTIETNFKRIK
ncbi:hypothetical protein, partial [Roseibium album]|uniref:hypothetical protein n=1 Tax=Roseibium album TaxID=311410 RepID=UPI003297A6F1